MAYYAEVNQEGICFAELETSGTADSATMIATNGFGHIGEKWNGSTWVDVPVVVTERFISGVEFLRRFTSAQRIAIRTLTKTDPIADDFMRLLDATIAQGSGVNLMDQDTIDGVGYLEVTIPAAAIDPAVILA